MSAAFQPKERIPVAVLGATGTVGQRFVSLLGGHPWFELVEVAASARSAGRAYGDAVEWSLPQSIPTAAASLTVRSVAEPSQASIVFSALDSQVALEAEEQHASQGCLVVSNASAHRMHPLVPLVVPEVNPDHLELLERQPWSGGIIAGPNCSTVGLVLALAPLVRRFGVQRAHVVTLQALSGAGLPGVPGLESLDNLLPYIQGEEEKLSIEPPKILGELTAEGLTPAALEVSAQCTRVPVTDGHTECVSVELGGAATHDELVGCWESFAGAPQELALPSAPSSPTIYLTSPQAPQPRLHRSMEDGMACVVGRLQPCPVLGWKFVCLSHNTLRGAAAGALLVAELAVARGHLDST